MSARSTFGFVEAVTLQVYGEFLFDKLCYLFGFSASPTGIVLDAFFEIFLVHLTLHIFPISAYFRSHTNGDNICIQQFGKFGNEGGEIQSGTDIVLAFAK